MCRYLVPILRSPTCTNTLQQYWLFLERNGIQLLPIDSAATEKDATDAARAFCEVNELTMEGDPFCVGDFVFAPVDPRDKDLRSFYSWSETPPGTSPPCESWRSFLWVGSADADLWGVNKLLDKVQLAESPAASAYSVLIAYRGATVTGEAARSRSTLPLTGEAAAVPP
jgi:hypothetical protein